MSVKTINYGASLGVRVSGIEKIQEVSARYNVLPEEIQKASTRAINRALRSVRTLGTRIAREMYTAPAKELTKDIRVKNAKRTDMSGEIIFSGGRGVPLHLFLPSPKKQPDWTGVALKARRPKEGVSTKIKRKGQRKIKFGEGGQKPFWVTTKRGHRALFYREGKNSYPIKPLFGPSPVQALMNEDAQKRLYDQAETTLNARLHHEMKRLSDVTK